MNKKALRNYTCMKGLDKKHNIQLYSMKAEEFEWHHGGSRRKGQGKRLKENLIK